MTFCTPAAFLFSKLLDDDDGDGRPRRENHAIARASETFLEPKETNRDTPACQHGHVWRGSKQEEAGRHYSLAADQPMASILGTLLPRDAAVACLSFVFRKQECASDRATSSCYATSPKQRNFETRPPPRKRRQSTTHRRNSH